MADKKRSVYLANPYGFSDDLNKIALPRIIDALEDIGLKVHEPFRINQHHVEKKESGWEYQVARNDHDWVHGADGLFAVVNGVPPDEGVMIELGMAIAWQKPIFLFRDDYRKATDSDEYPLNLMLFTGLPYITWKRYYYTSLDEIASRDMALFNWATFRDDVNMEKEKRLRMTCMSLPDPMRNQMFHADNRGPFEFTIDGQGG